VPLTGNRFLSWLAVLVRMTDEVNCGESLKSWCGVGHFWYDEYVLKLLCGVAVMGGFQLMWVLVQGGGIRYIDTVLT
jgi:hypothetical protein